MPLFRIFDLRWKTAEPFWEIGNKNGANLFFAFIYLEVYESQTETAHKLLTAVVHHVKKFTECRLNDIEKCE